MRLSVIVAVASLAGRPTCEATLLANVLTARAEWRTESGTTPGADSSARRAVCGALKTSLAVVGSIAMIGLEFGTLSPRKAFAAARQKLAERGAAPKPRTT